MLHFSVRGYLHTLLKIRHQKIKTSGKAELQRFLQGKCKISAYPTRFLIAVADIYSSQRPVNTTAWNIDAPIIQCTEKALIKLYGSLDDTHNLSQKVGNGITRCHEINVPITINSGGKYSQLCRSHLAKNSS